MGFFDGWRKKQAERTAEAAGAAEPAAQPDLTERVVETIRHAGFEPVVVSPNELTYTDANGGTGRMFLDNLRLQLRDVPPSQWQPDIDRFVRAMTHVPETASSLEEVRDRIYPRLVHRDMFPDEPEFQRQLAGAALPITDDLVALPAVDHPDQVSTELDVDKYGGWDTLWPVAVGNLRQLPRPAYRRFDAESGDASGAVHLFESEDFFGASRLFVIDDVLTAEGLNLDLSNGCLVAMPARTVVAIHPLTDAKGMLDAMKTLSYIAESEVPGALTDRVHYRATDGTLQPVSEREGTSVTIKVTGKFEDAMRAIGAIS